MMMKNRRDEEIRYLMNNRSLDRLENEFNYMLNKWNYLPVEWEWETMATQLATAICKIDYRWHNDGDRYDRQSCRYELWTFANRIHNNVFKLKRFNDYEDNLKYLLIKWMRYLIWLDKYPKKWSVYEEKWVRFRG